MSASPLPAIGGRDAAPGTPRSRRLPVDLDRSLLRAALWPVTLAFRDPALEARFQVVTGRQGLVGYRLSCFVGVLLWLAAMVIVPARHPDDRVIAVLVGAAGALMNVAGLWVSRWTTTLDRQNLAATPNAIASGIFALALAHRLGVTEAYAASALVLIGVYWFIARVRFVFAAMRTLALLVAFGVAVAVTPDPRSLALDAFILLAAMAGILLGLYRMELTARRLFRSDLALEAHSAELASENGQVHALLRNILPAPVADRLRAGEDTIADDVPDATVLFADLVGFTPLAHGMLPGELVRHLDELFSRFDALADDAGIEKIKTIGDAYMAVGGLPDPLPDHPARVVALGLAMIDAVAAYARESGLPLALRVGVHTGPLVAGIIGMHRFQYDLWGDTVNVASRLEATGVPGTVQVSGTTMRRLSGRFPITCRGPVVLKGVGAVETWLVEGGAG